MLVYEDYHFGEPLQMTLYHIQEFSHFAHLHRSYELIYLKKGQLLAYVDGREFPMQPGDFILILPYEIHHYTNLHHAECQINVFSPDYIREFHKMTEKQALENPVFRLDSQEFPALFHRLFPQQENPLYSKACLYYIGAKLLEETRLVPKSARHSDLLHQILIYIQEHYLEGPSLQDLAGHLGYSRLYLSRYINNALGMSYTDLLNQHRINYAAHLLHSTDASISDIAYSCGYNNLRSFNRCFKAYENKTPREYKAGIQR